MMLRVKVKELSTDPEFKASLGWYSNWKRRHSISMRAKTSLAQRLPADMEDKVVEFHRFVLRSRQRWGYDLSRILNMDETPMRFELPATKTLEFTGSRTVPVLSCGADKQSFTVALAVKANGEKLPPKVIFKGVRQPNINTPPRMQISVHKKGWMDEEGMFFPPQCLFQRRHFSSERHDYRNSKRGSNDCIVVKDIMLLSTCC